MSLLKCTLHFSQTPWIPCKRCKIKSLMSSAPTIFILLMQSFNPKPEGRIIKWKELCLWSQAELILIFHLYSVQEVIERTYIFKTVIMIHPLLCEKLTSKFSSLNNQKKKDGSFESESRNSLIRGLCPKVSNEIVFKHKIRL